jgi:hypothetical protein
MSWPFAFALLPIFAGVAALRFSPKIARLLLYIAVPGLSLVLIPIGIIGWVETLRGARPPYDFLGLTLFLAWTTGPALLLWCDAELIREALRERKRRMECDQSTLGRKS